MKQKYIIGLGCSWTQGEGGYPQEVVDEHNGYTQLRPGQKGQPDTDYYLREHELEISWVNQLTKYHFPEYKSVNLGIKGIGNTAAVNQLHFANNYDFTNAEGIVILMLTGFERFDVFQDRPMDHWGFKEPDGYNKGHFKHEKWRTAWPMESDQGDYKFWNCYARELWSEQFVACMTMMALLNLQSWAKAHNFQIVLANSFNQRMSDTKNWHDGIQNWLFEYAGPLVSQFNWSGYLHNDPDVEYVAFMEKLVDLDGLIPKPASVHWGGFNEIYNPRNLSTHSEYLTNDDGAHPTIKGYRVIADELAKFINKRGYIEKSQFCKP